MKCGTRGLQPPFMMPWSIARPDKHVGPHCGCTIFILLPHAAILIYSAVPIPHHEDRVDCRVNIVDNLFTLEDILTRIANVDRHVHNEKVKVYTAEVPLNSKPIKAVIRSWRRRVHDRKQRGTLTSIDAS